MEYQFLTNFYHYNLILRYEPDKGEYCEMSRGGLPEKTIADGPGVYAEKEEAAPSP